MLNGYVTYDELKLITGFNDYFLSKLITKGLNLHEADLEYNNLNKLCYIFSRYLKSKV